MLSFCFSPVNEAVLGLLRGAIYELSNEEIRKIAETTFSDAGVTERGDLQRLLRKQVDVIAPDSLVVSEEFGECLVEGSIFWLLTATPTWSLSSSSELKLAATWSSRPFDMQQWCLRLRLAR